MMYITSRGFPLPRTVEAMKADLRFHVWTKQFWPYRELQAGDDLYWYETPTTTIVWKTRVEKVEAFPYSDIHDALHRLESELPWPILRSQAYLDNRPTGGCCLGYNVRVLEQVC